MPEPDPETWKTFCPFPALPDAETDPMSPLCHGLGRAVALLGVIVISSMLARSPPLDSKRMVFPVPLANVMLNDTVTQVVHAPEGANVMARDAPLMSMAPVREVVIP